MTPAHLGTLQQWATETRAILYTIERLVEYFGEEPDVESLRRALAVPRFWLDHLEDVGYQRKDPPEEAARLDHSHVNFICDRSLAQMITPALLLIVEPWPEFIDIARAECSPELRKALVTKFGMMSGELVSRVCRPLWEKYPELKPEGFK
jgi:hypothetical protein